MKTRLFWFRVPEALAPELRPIAEAYRELAKQVHNLPAGKDREQAMARLWESRTVVLGGKANEIN